jgi:DNA invertase Pin-like site-specific DNA recombinase
MIGQSRLSAKRSFAGHAKTVRQRWTGIAISDKLPDGRKNGQVLQGFWMTAIGYARVSTADQDPALQVEALRAAGCARLFEDQASGARADRPGLAEALAYLRAGDTLVVWKLDRLGRSLSHLIEVVRDLDGRGVGFRSLTENIDTATPGGRLVFHLFGALAQFERDLIRERTRAGLDAASAGGRKGGRRVVVTPERLRKARALIAGGLTVREAAARIKVSKTALYAALGRE